MLNQAQLDALFKRIAAGTDTGGAFAAATPGMDENERNQWVNMYGSGGTNYKDYLDWYGQNQTALNRDPNPAPWQPGGIFGPPGTSPGGPGAIKPPTDVQNPWLGGGGAASVWTPTPFTPATTTATGNTGASGLTGGVGVGVVPHPGISTKPALVQAVGRDTRNVTPMPPTPAVVQTTATPPPAPTVKPLPFNPGVPRNRALRGVWQ